MRNANYPHDEELSIAETLDLLDEKEVALFMKLTPDWKPRAGDSQMLFDRACEVAGNLHPYLSDYQIALVELRQQDPEFGRYVAPEPKPEDVQKPDNGIIEVPTNTGAKLTVDPAVRAELNKLPLRELARRAAVDRHANLSDQRKRQIKASEI